MVRGRSLCKPTTGKWYSPGGEIGTFRNLLQGDMSLPERYSGGEVGQNSRCYIVVSGSPRSQKEWGYLS